MRAIVLNADYSFLNITASLFESVKLLAKNRVVPLAVYERKARSESQEFEIPAVAILRDHVRMGRRRQGFTLPSHKNVFIRDGEKCAYCGCKLSLRTVTKDHVIPRCKGGQDTMTNVVAACKDCNGRKADRTLADSGMRLRDGVELRHLNDDEKLTVLLKTGGDAVERKAWIGYLKKTGMSLF